MLTIRLQVGGRTHKRHYSIVAMDSRIKRDGKFIEKIGYWDPHTKKAHVNLDRVSFHVKNGAQISEAVKRIINRVQSVEASTPETTAEPIETIENTSNE